MQIILHTLDLEIGISQFLTRVFACQFTTFVKDSRHSGGVFNLKSAEITAKK